MYIAMTRIAYFNSELAKNLGYKHDIIIIGQMTDDEKCEVFNISPGDIDDLEQMIADYYAFC